MSQTTLADKIGVTFQQVQKYEKGTNRVGSSRLQCIANALGLDPAALFGEQTHFEQQGGALSPEASLLEFAITAESISLNGSFSRIRSVAARRSIIALVKALATDAESSSGNTAA
jgi:transcriptional regulator with XRE-family HTH domain